MDTDVSCTVHLEVERLNEGTRTPQTTPRLLPFYPYPGLRTPFVS